MNAVQAVERMVPPDERVLGAFIGISGPRPGVEALAVPVFAIVLVVTSSYWLAIPLVIAVFAGVNVARTFMTVARTDVNVLVIETGRRRLPARDSAFTRLPTDAIVMADGAGDASVSVGHVRLWVNGSQQDEARRLSRLMPTQDR